MINGVNIASIKSRHTHCNNWFLYNKLHGKPFMLSREKQNLFLNVKFCISKNMACFSKVFRLMPCFSKCKILHSETDFVFHARHVNAQESIFIKNPSILHPFFSLFLRKSYRKTLFHAKNLWLSTTNPLSKKKSMNS